MRAAFPLKIAMLAACPFPTSQGSQVLIRELSEALVRRGHCLHIVTYHFGEPIECPGLIIHRIPEIVRYNKYRSGPEIRKPLLDFLLMRKLEQIIRLEGIQIVHAHNYEAPLAAWPVCRKHAIPLVYHSHNTMSDEFYTYFRLKIPQALARAAAHLMDRFIPRRADFIIAINPRVARFLIEMGAPPSKIKYIPPGVNYGEPSQADQAVRVQYGLRDEQLILYVGNLDGYQRLDLLLDALPLALRTQNNAKFVLMSGSPCAAFKAEVQRRGLTQQCLIIENPTFEQVKAMLAHGSLAVNSRISWSGFPIKLLNYMAAGLPIAAFAGAAQPVVNGITGILAAPGDAPALARAIRELLVDSAKAQSMGREARRLAQREYSWIRIAADVERIYYRLLRLPTGIREPAPPLPSAIELPKFEYSA
jgi:glycosyltransferase involved in cell wall biosynthesis